ncbi:MAG: PQQ-dependent sugar dehydrogenase [Sphingobacteriaceae bacterium]|nr:PQQ-dependent sugar dehydrogenase [Cytophagaceae bacterium]
MHVPRSFFLLSALLVGACSDPDTGTNPNPTPTLPTTPVGGFRTRTVIATLDVPWELTWGPDSRLWTTERRGIVSRIDPNTGEKQTLLTLTDCQQTGESGLLGLALHPDFVQTPFVYLAYTYSKSGAITEKLVRYRYENNALSQPTVLLDNIAAAAIHDGCRLQFLPDKTLLMSTGDASNTAFSQNKSSLNGKILRLSADGSIPADNPFPGSYVWSSGHRNAQGLLLHPNGLVYSSEHGPDTDDEINIVRKGGNYGWPNVRGPVDASEQAFAQANSVTGSILHWTPTIAPSDLAWYASDRIPAFKNKLLMSVLKNEMLVAVTLSADGLSATGQESFLRNQFGRLRDVCVSPDGRVFLATNSGSANTHRIIELSGAE